MTGYIEMIIVLIAVAVFSMLAAVLLQSFRNSRRIRDYLRFMQDAMNDQISRDNREAREELDNKIDRLRDSLANMSDANRAYTQKAVTTMSKDTQDALHNFLRHTSDGMEKIRGNVDEKLTAIQISNVQKLDEMQKVVDEKLEKTLEARLHKSFEAVSIQLESVNRGLGEMKAVAQSVGSLSRILSGTKSRGILGEVQLGQIIEDMLPAQLYEREAAIKIGSSNRVDYAVKLPGTEENQHVYLPIDSKFPLESYERLLDAYDSNDAAEIDSARKHLHSRIKTFAKDIRDKYISPPETTHFAVMFLPAEGLYAEVARDATFFEGIRQDGIVISGPTTFSAMLNSLQLGFKTLQIQKGAADIEKTLGAVKKEFGTFETVLSKAHQRITQAGNEIENLVGTRTRAINRSLREVQVYTGDDSRKLIGITENES